VVSVHRISTATLALLLLVGCGHRVTEQERRQAQNRARLATSMLMEGEFAAALREARRALELDPECSDCRLTLATIYAARTEFNRAEAELLTLLEAEPDNPFALNTLASVYLNMGRPAEGEEFARRASENESYAGRHLAFYNLGWSHQERQQYTEAVEAYSQALRESPRMCLARYRIGEVYFRQRQFEQALRFLEQAATEPVEESQSGSSEREEQRACNEMPDVHYLLGLTLSALERQGAAVEAFSRCAELTSDGGDLHRRCAQQAGSIEEPEGQD
jgi:type IV pilus assembly protein PilF